MPHLHLMNWNFKEELVKSARQAVSGGTAPKPLITSMTVKAND